MFNMFCVFRVISLYADMYISKYMYTYAPNTAMLHPMLYAHSCIIPTYEYMCID